MLRTPVSLIECTSCPSIEATLTQGTFSMALLELRLILSKLLWKYDFVLVDDALDWVAANRTFVFWKKPALWVQFTPRDTQE